jgi:hypothetical protein
MTARELQIEKFKRSAKTLEGFTPTGFDTPNETVHFAYLHACQIEGKTPTATATARGC